MKAVGEEEEEEQEEEEEVAEEVEGDEEKVREGDVNSCPDNPLAESFRQPSSTFVIRPLRRWIGVE